MATPAHPGRTLFVSIPVSDLARSKAFFAQLGFSFNPAFSGATAACMLISEQASIMLLTREKFEEFSKVPVADPALQALALYAFCVASREEVDAVREAAVAAGAELRRPADAMEWGGYSGAFADPEGYVWEVAHNPGWPLGDDGSVRLPAG